MTTYARLKRARDATTRARQPYEAEMKIINDSLTKSYREPGKCRFCKRSVKLLCGAHILAKGHGGGRQVDIPCNLVRLGFDPWSCKCHVWNHAGQSPTTEDLLKASAEDHNCSPFDIVDLVHLINRMPPIRGVDEDKYRWFVKMELSARAQQLAIKELESFKHLLLGAS